ncbi:Nuclear receptor domain-containing protein [Trichostrongylus colubriformis]|uniref:Nuclear receptor domain-containing protein n=1 Tax=Trichostrongylus colubriformis TaxID=6319 RepID=A0AAN8F2C2_TRICO
MNMNRHAVQHERPNGSDHRIARHHATSFPDGDLVTSTSALTSEQDDSLKRFKVCDFSVSRLVAPPGEYSLYSLIRSWSSSAPMSSVDVDDQKILFSNSWHLIFFLGKACQKGPPSHYDGKDKVIMSWTFVSSLHLSPFEQWCISSMLLFRPEDSRLKSPKTVREIQLQTAGLLVGCLSARAAVHGSAQSSTLMLVPLTICQILPEDVQQHFFAESSLAELQHICTTAVI